MKNQKKILLLLLASTGLGQFTQAASEKKVQSSDASSPSKTPVFQRNYGMAGCGLGSVIIGKKGGQIFAATSNSTAYNQMFGISFGTLNCEDQHSLNQVADRVDRFISNNRIALASDISRGQGESLESLAVMLRCSDAGVLGRSLQMRFGEIYPDSGVGVNEVTDSILNVMISDDQLVSQCRVKG